MTERSIGCGEFGLRWQEGLQTIVLFETCRYLCGAVGCLKVLDAREAEHSRQGHDTEDLWPRDDFPLPVWAVEKDGVAYGPGYCPCPCWCGVYLSRGESISVNHVTSRRYVGAA